MESTKLTEHDKLTNMQVYHTNLDKYGRVGIEYWNCGTRELTYCIFEILPIFTKYDIKIFSHANKIHRN